MIDELKSLLSPSESQYYYNTEQYEARTSRLIKSKTDLNASQTTLDNDVREEDVINEKVENVKETQEEENEVEKATEDKGIQVAEKEVEEKVAQVEKKHDELKETIRKEEEFEEKQMEKKIIEDGFHFPITVLDNEVVKAVTSLQFNFNESSGKFQISFDDEIDSVQLSFVLNYTLGFQEGRYLENNEIAKRMPDLRGGIDQLYVYTNVCQDMIVGDRLTNMIRNVSVSGKPGQVIEKIYDSPIYNKIMHHSLDEIEVDIRTNDGRPIPFETGEVTVTLFFKKVLFM
ncbi:hypothetical protein Ddc_24826 [Ditylenchus destructor]|nr:hypothetical protein Ddc_24826 [Ditylenchus destructor]